MIEEIRDRTGEAKSYAEWFEDGWNRHKGAIDDLIAHNKQLCADNAYLIEQVEKLQQENIRLSLRLHSYDNQQAILQQFIERQNINDQKLLDHINQIPFEHLICGSCYRKTKHMFIVSTQYGKRIMCQHCKEQYALNPMEEIKPPTVE